MTRLDDEGTAFGWFGIIAFLIMAGVLIICMAPLSNFLSDEVNKQIEDGTVSTQTVQAFDFGRTLITHVLVPITLIGVFMFIIVRALEQKKVEG